jgi:predicted ATP-grasp superfamily ATP-dependent carboligase
MHCNLNNSKKILILNGDNRNGLAVVRSLGQKNHQCDIAQTKRQPFSRKLGSLLKSKYVRKIHYLPQIENESNLLFDLIRLINHEKYNYLLPAGTEATNFTSKFKSKLSLHVTPLVEDYSKLWTLHNKIECMKLVKSIGIPIPETFVISTIEDLKCAAEKIHYPVVIKHADSFASKGIWTFPRGGHALVEEYVNRIPRIKKCNTHNNYPFIQKSIQGQLMDTTAFAVEGKVIAALSQQRLLKAWLDGGGGIVNLTNNIPEIKQYTQKIIREIQWTGPIEMDWIMEDRTNKFMLLEINPKFWGTTQLTIEAGYDFPSWLLDHAMGREIQAPAGYKTGLMYRWFIDELETVLSVPETRTRLFKELRGFLNRFRYRPCKSDIWLSDFRPVIKSGIFFLYRLFFQGRLKNIARMILRSPKHMRAQI